MIDKNRHSTHIRERSESVAAELLAGGIVVEAGKSRLVATRNEAERGWRTVQ